MLPLPSRFVPPPSLAHSECGQSHTLQELLQPPPDSQGPTCPCWNGDVLGLKMGMRAHLLEPKGSLHHSRTGQHPWTASCFTPHMGLCALRHLQQMRTEHGHHHMSPYFLRIRQNPQKLQGDQTAQFLSVSTFSGPTNSYRF